MRVNDSRVISWLVIVLLGIAVFVWPTRYRFERVGLGSSPSVLVRINRLTGNAEMLTGSGWSPMEGPKSDNPNSGPTSLPPDQLGKLDGRGSWCISTDNTFCVDLYNGSNWRVSEVSVVITATNDDDSVKWEHRFDARGLDLPPFSTKKGYVETPDKATKFSWHILAATGTLEESAAPAPRPPLNLDLGGPPKPPLRSPWTGPPTEEKAKR